MDALKKYSITIFDGKAIDDSMEDELMNIENSCFEEAIRETWESKKELIQDSIIAVFAKNDGYIGEGYLSNEESGDMGDEGHTDTIHLAEVFSKMKSENGLYFMSFAVLPEHWGGGIGKEIVKTALSAAKEKGFSCVYSHANSGASEHIFKSIGGVFLEKRENWFDTGNTHSLYRIPLDD